MAKLTPRRQGELGELSAIEWLSWKGACVFTPHGHSPDVDLVADFGEGPLRVEVKTATRRVPSGNWHVMIATAGGNQSWSGIVKHFDSERCEFLFVHVGDGRRWFIPTAALEAVRGIHLGGPKYSEYEVERGKPLTDAVPLQSRVPLGECQSGQMEQTVNLPSYDYGGSNPPSPISFRVTKYERTRGKQGRALINGKRRVTIPSRAASEACLKDGDQVSVRAAGIGRLVIESVELPPGVAPAQPELTTPAEPAPGEVA